MCQSYYDEEYEPGFMALLQPSGGSRDSAPSDGGSASRQSSGGAYYRDKRD